MCRGVRTAHDIKDYVSHMAAPPGMLGMHVKHTQLLDPSIKFHCHIYNYYVFFSYEAMTVEHKFIQSYGAYYTVLTLQQINKVNKSAAVFSSSLSCQPSSDLRHPGGGKFW